MAKRNKATGDLKELGMFNIVGSVVGTQLKQAVSDAKPLPKTYAVNELAKSLHPDYQHLVVSDVRVWDANAKSFTFTADPDYGKKLAHMNAGNYICVELDIDGQRVTRPYSLSSSPRQSSLGTYTITVKRVKNGQGSNYILDNWTVGTKVTTSGPLGTFEYEPLRDGKTVIGIAGGSGITPFYSFAQAIADGDEDFNLVLLFGSRTEKDILFHDELDAIAARTPKVKVVNVLSDEEKDGFEHGFINGALIHKYAPKDDYSIFLCGPQQMYAFVDKELESFGLEQKWIRHENYEFHNPAAQPDYPKDVPETVSIKVHMSGETFLAKGQSGDSILQIMEKSGISAPSRCRAGECGWCRSRLISGDVYIPQGRDLRREADRVYGYIHPCCTYALTDLEIEVPFAK